MSFFSFTKKNKESYSLVFNISSGSITGAIIKFTEEAGVKIIHYIKEEIPFQQEVSVSKHLRLMEGTLSALAGKLKTDGYKKIQIAAGDSIIIDRVFYLFSSPWSTSQTRTIKIKESKPFKITPDYLDHLIGQQEKSFKLDISRAGKIIEKKIIQIKINGYTVNNYYNKYAKNLEIAVFFTVVPENVLNIIERSVTKTFNTNNIWCHSLSLSILSVINNIYPHIEDFIEIDVSEEITDISIIKDGVVVCSATIPLGRNSFIRELATLKISKEIADSMLKIHTLKKDDELSSLKIAVTMDTLANKWLTKINKIIDTQKEKIYVPESMFLITNNDLAPFLKEKLQLGGYKIQPFDIKKVKPSIISDDTIFKAELLFLDNLYKI